jgi:hypothetical protein
LPTGQQEAAEGGLRGAIFALKNSSVLLCLGVLMEILKPCWKCGQPPVASPAAVEAITQLWVIACPRCDEATEACSTIEAAAASWNGRAEPGGAPDASSPGEGEDGPEPAGELAESLALPA